VKDYDGETYRAIYTVRFVNAVYVLHVFQKKSPHGIATRHPMLLSSRSVEGCTAGLRGETWLDRDRPSDPKQRHVFADMGLPDAPELQTKARLCAAINQIVEREKIRRPRQPRSLESTNQKSLPFLTTSWKAFPLNVSCTFWYLWPGRGDSH